MVNKRQKGGVQRSVIKVVMVVYTFASFFHLWMANVEVEAGECVYEWCDPLPWNKRVRGKAHSHSCAID
jgi:hypothetical protein